MEMGARSFSTSKVRSENRLGAVASEATSISNKVWPSGGALATASAPRLPAAPGLFSTTTDWPMAADSFGLIRRARMSEVPPGAKGTISRTGRSKFWAPAPLEAKADTERTAAAIAWARDGIDIGISSVSKRGSARSRRFTGRLQAFEAALGEMIGHGPGRP